LLLEDLLEQEKREQQRQQPQQQPPVQQQSQTSQSESQNVPVNESHAQTPQQPQPPPTQTQQPNAQPMPVASTAAPQQVHVNLPPGAAPPNIIRARMPRPPGPPGPGAIVVGAVQQPRGPHPQQTPPVGGLPAQGLLPPNAAFNPRMQRPGPSWQPRHPQEITLQQRGPQANMMPGPPPGVIAPNLATGQTVAGHPALSQQEPPAPPPPQPLNVSPPPLPPDNPQTEEDRVKVQRYEEWLSQQEQNITQQLQYYEKEISRLRKQKKVRRLFIWPLINQSIAHYD